jgi:O-antigen/teichoic acid export membrane protein
MDQVLIGRVLGPAAVAHYAVPMSLVGRSQVVVLALGRALFPRFSRLNELDAKMLAERAVVSLGYAYGAICGAAMILGGPFLTIWVGGEFGAQATPVMEVLLIGAWANGLAVVPFALLQGRQRPDSVAKIHMFEVVPFVLLLWVLIHSLGLLGAAIAWTVRAAVDAIMLAKLARFEMSATVRTLLPPFVLLMAIYAIVQIGISVAWLVVFALLSTALFVAGAILFDPTSRQGLFGLSGRIRSAFRGASRESAISPQRRC